MSTISSTDSPEAELYNHIKAESVHLLYRQLMVALPVALINATFLVYVLWDVIPHTTLLVWFSLITTLTISRILQSYIYFSRTPSDTAAARWGTLFTTCALLHGLLWGIAGIILYVPDQIAYQAILYFLLTAMGAGAFAISTSSIPAFYAFFIPCLTPILVMLIIEGDRIHSTMAILGVAFFIAFLFFGRNAYHAQLESIRLRLENQRLLGELRNKHKNAEQANISKAKFLAAASHDLRQPLFALGLYTEMLGIETDIKKTHEIANLIKQSFLSLKGLLDALLDISKLDAGVMRVEKMNFSLRDIFDRIMFDYEPMAIDKGIKLRVVKTSAVVYSDPHLIERTLRNLVSNAIKYTHEGVVLVGLRRGSERHEICVSDTGIGIPQEELDNVFQTFYQVAKPRQDCSKGVGLGLAIVRRLVTLLGENISVRSEVGRGTSMSFSIQRGKETVPPTLVEKIPTTKAGAVILIIEDDKEVCSSMCAFLEELGYVTLSAGCEDEALRILIREKSQPDMIISDYCLGQDSNGIAAAETVLAYLGKKLPVMIITGDTAPERIKEAASHGYQLQHKPIAPEIFVRTITQMLSIRRQT